MTDVEIEYCVPCGFLDRAEAVQRALLTSLGDDLDSVALVTGEHGVFRVDVDGDTIYEKAEDGDYDTDALVAAVRERTDGS